ncbi:hypothetical protein ACJX0J_007969 [Zea mays]
MCYGIFSGKMIGEIQGLLPRLQETSLIVRVFCTSSFHENKGAFTSQILCNKFLRHPKGSQSQIYPDLELWSDLDRQSGYSFITEQKKEGLLACIVIYFYFKL